LYAAAAARPGGKEKFSHPGKRSPQLLITYLLINGRVFEIGFAARCKIKHAEDVMSCFTPSQTSSCLYMSGCGYGLFIILKQLPVNISVSVNKLMHNMRAQLLVANFILCVLPICTLSYS
jgi:hypothetical protein